MKIETKDLFKNSFVLTIDDLRYKEFDLRWRNYGLPSIRPFRGFCMDTREYPELKTTIGSTVADVSFSHYAIVKSAEALDLPFVFILEDDALPCKKILDRLQVVLNHIPDDLKVLKLGWVGKWQPPGRNPNDLVDIFTEGTHAYIVFKRYYREYEHIFNSVNAIADVELLNHDPKKLSVYHSLFAQKNPYSGYIEVHSYGTARSTRLMQRAAGGNDFDWS